MTAPHSAPPGAVLVAGDVNLDLVLTGDVVPRFGQAEQLLDDGRLVLGGSAAIVAHGLARLGVPTRFVGRVGDDAFGRIALDALASAGVDTSAVTTDPALPTGLSVILSAPRDRAILTVPGTIPTLSPEAVRDAADGAAHVHVASYFLQPSLAEGLPGLLGGIRSTGATTSLDTNWDPAERWAGLAAVLPQVDVLLPNLEELRAIARSLAIAGDDAALARALAATGPRVVVKAGADGGWSATADGVVDGGPVSEVGVVDTTGAGDSFDAGYLAALHGGVADERERLRRAVACGSLSTRAVGGTDAQATAAELSAALARAAA